MEQENKLKSNHKVEITDRNETKITCVNKLNSFNDKEFYLETDFGNMQITGSNMTLGKMDVENKVLVINGNINSLRYLTKNSKDINSSIWKKLFRCRIFYRKHKEFLDLSF